MAKQTPRPKRKKKPSIWRGFLPAMPATLGTMALVFLFAAVMPLAWVGGLAWNLYLDRFSSLFVPPVGDAGRLVLAIALALVGGLIALIAALALAKPAVQGNRAMNNRVAARARQQEDAALAEPSRRRRADLHPDDPVRAPISAERDLPAEGLGSVGSFAAAPAMTSEDDAFELADIATDDDLDLGAFDIEPAPPLSPSPAAADDDRTLGAMVARFEAGLARRRAARLAPAGYAANDPATQAAAPASDEPVVDLALEAALSTLQRMTRSANG